MGPLYRLFHNMAMRGPESILEKVVFPALVLCGWVYGGIGCVRFLLYRFNILPSFKAEVPVISVGNLCAGGTGKTPVVEYLARHFLSLGKKTAVVSRGYGRNDIRHPKIVSRGGGPLISPALAGDEPFLLAKRNPLLAVVVAVDRKEGILMAVKDCAVEIVILDDGFQHLAVKRDLDIVLLDASRPWGNGHVLPGGPLREFPTALNRADIFILTRMQKGTGVSIDLPRQYLSCHFDLSSQIYLLAGEKIDMNILKDRKGLGFAGIADPGQFFKSLANAGLNIVETASFQDHSGYGKKEMAYLNYMAQGVDYFITTEKDAVKIHPEDFDKDCYVVPLSVEISETDKLAKILSPLI